MLDSYPYVANVQPGNDHFSYRAAIEAQRLANNARDAENRMNEYAVEYHKKFAIAFACIVFVLVGAPIAVRFPRGGVGMVIAISLTIFGIYYVSLIGTGPGKCAGKTAFGGHLRLRLSLSFVRRRAAPSAAWNRTFIALGA
jgi:lipopolysaccharide export LptBFGC system permease protein LptF